VVGTGGALTVEITRGVGTGVMALVGMLVGRYGLGMTAIVEPIQTTGAEVGTQTPGMMTGDDGSLLVGGIEI